MNFRGLIEPRPLGKPLLTRISRLTLTSFKFGVAFANHVNSTATTHDFAVFMAGFG